MKKRVFSEMDNMVYRVIVDTEDWSQGDIELMEQFGEPEVNVGGEIYYTFNGEERTITLGDEYVRLMHGFPYARGFDSRDFDECQDVEVVNYADQHHGVSCKVGEAVAVGRAWKEEILGRIDDAVVNMRSLRMPLPTEEVSEI